jgi:hypothetical protein
MYRVILIINDCRIAVGVENPHKFWMCRSLAKLDKLVGRFPLSPIAPPIGDTSITHVMRLAAHSTMYVTNAYCDGTIIYNDPVQVGVMLCSLSRASVANRSILGSVST